MMWNAARSLLSGPAMALVPLLMLPAVIGAAWIALEPETEALVQEYLPESDATG